jgi:hypothetical protein
MMLEKGVLMSKVRQLIELFGSGWELSRAAGVSRVLVTRWAHKGNVPTHYNHQILEAARAAGLDLAKVSACLDEHVCPCCGQPLEPGQGLNVKSSLVRKSIKDAGK